MDSKFKIKKQDIHKRGRIGYPVQIKRDFQIHFLKQMMLQPNDNILDVGCGTLRGAIPIIDYLDAGHYVGTEMRETAYRGGIEELDLYPELKAKSPTIILSNINELKIDRKFDIIWAYAVLFHIPDDDLPKAFKQIEKYLAPGGVFYGNIEQETHTGWGKDIPAASDTYPLLFRTLEHFQKAAGMAGLTVEDIGTCSQYGHVGYTTNEDEQRMLKFQRK